MNKRTSGRAAKKAARKAAKKAAKTLPLIATGLVPAATLTSVLVSPLALAESGDLDPTFGDVGRLGPILDGPVWSAESLDDGSMLLGGGDSYYYYYYYYWGWTETTNFVGLVSDTGAIDPSFVNAGLGDAQVFGVARQPDGKTIAVGRLVNGDYDDTRLVVLRLEPDSSPDPAFGNNGIVMLGAVDYGPKTAATSVVLDPDGRIVVAGTRDDNVMVLRLLPDGALDGSFGTDGVFDGPANFDYSGGRNGARTNLLRTDDGRYRVTASSLGSCQVVALRPDGALDDSFGDGGIATVATPAGSPTYCNSMAAQPDGRLLVAGSAGAQGFAARLLETGQPDPGFSAGAIQAQMTEATAVDVDNDGLVVVAGSGVSGVSIMRLLASGELDALFGQDGAATFDLRTDGPASPVVRDLFVQADNRILAAGGVDEYLWSSHRAFVVRLLDDVGQSPGVLGITQQTELQSVEGDGEIVIDVRRTGGSTGSVSVDWETATTGNYSVLPYYAGAEPSQDYAAVSGTLAWGDGDTALQQIRIPVLADDIAEEPETFRVVLTGSQGGAGLGQSGAIITIGADGSPFGQFGFAEDVSVPEGTPARIGVLRNYYLSGIVTVTVTPVSGTAVAGEDFVAAPVTLTWADGEAGWKTAVIPIVDDTTQEGSETFTVELSNPTGGAVIGPRWRTTVGIYRNDTPQSAGSGGGAFGVFSLLLLGMLRWLRRTADQAIFLWQGIVLPQQGCRRPRDRY
ncbi:MAG: hypothetical protein OEV41_06170 [Gammaproteobacteria bacterium]|nr:hypothetical protein [Gammaproteobacteria bacterium]